MDLALILADLFSRDVSRIRGACAEISASWDRDFLSALASHIAEIKAATEGIEWGGLFMSNSVHLQSAIQRAEYARSNSGCFCRIYDIFTNPEREQEKGHATISKFQMELRTYQVSCNECGTAYEVEELDYHYTWWKWMAKTNPV